MQLECALDQHIFALAMKAGITVEQLRQFVFAYPTFSSAITSMLPEPNA